MSNLVERLRALVIIDEVHSQNLLGKEAADHIEKLEAALREIVQHSEIYPNPNMRRAIDTMMKIARTALSHSPPPFAAPHNSGERLPSSNAAAGGGDTKAPEREYDPNVALCDDAEFGMKP